MMLAARAGFLWKGDRGWEPPYLPEEIVVDAIELAIRVTHGGIDEHDMAPISDLRAAEPVVPAVV
jgi:hypothetical protein